MFYAAEGGGVRTYLSAKANWLKQRHAHIRHTIVGPGREEDLDDIGFIGVPSVPIPYGNGYRMPLSSRVAERILQRLQPDLIEVGDPYQFAWSALRARRELNVPVVAFYHSDIQQIVHNRFGPRAGRAVEKYASYLYRRFDLVLAPSKLMVQRLRDMGVERVRQQPLGVDTSIYTPSCRDDGLRAQLGLPANARLLVYAGRFAAEKKLPVLIDAVHRLGHPYYLLMIGSGDEIPSSSQVIAMPFQRDPYALARLIASCDVLAHPGDQETFGLVVLEAMACGIPVVGMDAGGVSELVDQDTGVLVSPGSASALAEGIEYAYTRDCAVLGAQARQKVLQCYDWNMIIPQLIAQYAHLFAARQRAELEAGLAYARE
jgi:alpha-1,6-mannosyltransferase